MTPPLPGHADDERDDDEAPQLVASHEIQQAIDESGDDCPTWPTFRRRMSQWLAIATTMREKGGSLKITLSSDDGGTHGVDANTLSSPDLDAGTYRAELRLPGHPTLVCTSVKRAHAISPLRMGQCPGCTSIQQAQTVLLRQIDSLEKRAIRAEEAAETHWQLYAKERQSKHGVELERDGLRAELAEAREESSILDPETGMLLITALERLFGDSDGKERARAAYAALAGDKKLTDKLLNSDVGAQLLTCIIQATDDPELIKELSAGSEEAKH